MQGQEPSSPPSPASGSSDHHSQSSSTPYSATTPLSTSSFVYPVRTLLAGKIQPAANPLVSTSKSTTSTDTARTFFTQGPSSDDHQQLLQKDVHPSSQDQQRASNPIYANANAPHAALTTSARASISSLPSASTSASDLISDSWGIADMDFFKSASSGSGSSPGVDGARSGGTSNGSSLSLPQSTQSPSPESSAYEGDREGVGDGNVSRDESGKETAKTKRGRTPGRGGRSSPPNFRDFPQEGPVRRFSMRAALGESSGMASSLAHFASGWVNDMHNVVSAIGATETEDPVLQNEPLPLVASGALATRSVSLLPTPPAPLQDHRPADYFDTRARSRQNAVGVSQTPSGESEATEIPTPGNERDNLNYDVEDSSPGDEGEAVPFNPSQYGIVHLDAVPSSESGSGSDRGSSSISEVYYSARSTGDSNSISGGGSGPSSTHGSRSPRLRLYRQQQKQARALAAQEQGSSGITSGITSSRQSRSGGSTFGETETSLSSDDPLVTVQFQHVEDENGHHVIVGREGRLVRCEDEPIHTPGAVQGFGVLIALEDVGDTLVVRQVSENAAELLGLSPNYLFSLECFTDTLPEHQLDIAWDNINFIEDSDAVGDEDGCSPHVFLLSGWGEPGSALPDDPNKFGDRRTWTCWCAVHKMEKQGESDPSNGGLIIMEFELEKDHLNPLYPVARSTVTSPVPDSEEGLFTYGPPSSSNATPGEKKADGQGGMEGDDTWAPSQEMIAESTTTYSKPIPALERLRKASRSGSVSEGSSSSSGSSRKRGRRQERNTTAGVGMMDVFSVMGQIDEQLGDAPDLESFLKIVVGVIKDLTQFHRVLIYQFDEMWNGQVVAELVDWDKSRDLFRGLHFPAMDIPAQARQLYTINKVRLLYDRSQPTARIVCRDQSDLKTPLNMTHCYLRAMSPIHIKYLENMGVRASMSVSITAFGQLWGLVSCHTYGSYGMRVSFPVRQMLRLLSQSISRNIERLSYAQRLHTRKLVNTMTSDQNSTGYIVSNADDLLSLFDADFGILVIGEGAKILGPNQHGQEILVVAEYLRLKQFTTIQASQAVINDYPDLKLSTGLEVIAGLLYVPLSKGGKDFIAFLRRGQPRHVHWAGRPYREGQEVKPLEPRKSFKIWSEKVAGRCRTWTDEQLDTAGVLALVYGKFIEVWRQKQSVLQSTKITNLILSNASHEVRTPLNHIINYLEMALNGSLDKETRENLSRSHAASKSLLFTINDLLDLTRIESGNELSFYEPFNLHHTIEDATYVYRREAERRSISFILQLYNSPRYVIGDAKKIRTVVQNLTANALKYTEEGSITVQCSTFEEPAGLRGDNQTVVEIVVADTGCGIEPTKLESIFREFEQVESTEAKPNSASGLGLGLAVVARIVEQLGGQLRVDSTVGTGSQFSFLIPLAISHQTDSDGSGKSSSSVSSGRSSKLGTSISRPDSLRERHNASEIEGLVEALAESSRMMLEGEHGKARSEGSEGSRSSRPGSFRRQNSQVAIRPIKIEGLELDPPIPASRVVGASISGSVASSSQPSSFPSVEPSKLRVLIVEDNEINRNILSKRLTMGGHKVATTNNGQECLNAIENDNNFDLVFMDIQMPILNGFEATQGVREIEKKVTPRPDSTHRLSRRLNGRIPIFAISASLKEEQREELMNYGMDGWILKPIDFKRLNVLIKGVLDPVQRRKDLYSPGCNWEIGGWFRDAVEVK